MVSRLKQARRESGKTLQEISSALKIRKHYLIALEEGNTELLPGEVYAKGYVKLYENYLGINDESELIDDDVSQDILLQNKVDYVNCKYKKPIITLSILMLIIIPMIYCLITQS